MRGTGSRPGRFYPFCNACRIDYAAKSEPAASGCGRPFSRVETWTFQRQSILPSIAARCRGETLAAALRGATPNASTACRSPGTIGWSTCRRSASTRETLPLLVAHARDAGCSRLDCRALRRRKGESIRSAGPRCTRRCASTTTRRCGRRPRHRAGHPRRAGAHEDARRADPRRRCASARPGGRFARSSTSASVDPISVRCSCARRSRRHRARVAASGPQTEGVDVAFVSNVDPEHLTRALAPLDPATTLFIVTSKTFTTQETLANAASAKAWLASALGRGVDVGAHFVARDGQHRGGALHSASPRQTCLPLWDWVGGRYSLWSAAGLPIVLKLGWDRFAELLAGAASVDHALSHDAARTQSAGACSVLRAGGTPPSWGTPSASSFPTRRRWRDCPRTCSSSSSKATASASRATAARWPVRRRRRCGARPAPMASTRFSNGCIRERAKRRSNSSCPSARRIRSPTSSRCSSRTRSRRRRR